MKPETTSWVGLDIGGANIKLADGKGYAASQPFPLWRDPDGLTQRLRTAIAQAPRTNHLAVTMTGELADCFETKEAGVSFILRAVEEAADGRHTRVYLSNGKFVSLPVACRRTEEAAAANWHALASFIGGLEPRGTVLVIDVGSTTTDVIPVIEGRIHPVGTVDVDRLLSGSLAYLGVERTPVCSLVERLPYRDRQCPVARELFATTRDAFLILGDLPEEGTCLETADGRPATKAAARKRLGRMLCADETTFNHRDAVKISEAIAECVATLIAAAIDQVSQQLPSDVETVVIAGAGEFVARRAVERIVPGVSVTSLAQRFGSQVSRCAPAHAVAVIAGMAVGR